MISTELVDLSRLQFAATAMYHYLFVPLTLGLSMLLVAMEACYVVTGKQVYKDMVKFWGKLFGINFALGQDLHRNIRVRCCNRYHHGVPVRNQLVILFSLCGRYLRRSAGD